MRAFLQIIDNRANPIRRNMVFVGNSPFLARVIGSTLNPVIPGTADKLVPEFVRLRDLVQIAVYARRESERDRPRV